MCIWKRSLKYIHEKPFNTAYFDLFTELCSQFCFDQRAKIVREEQSKSIFYLSYSFRRSIGDFCPIFELKFNLILTTLLYNWMSKSWLNFFLTSLNCSLKHNIFILLYTSYCFIYLKINNSSSIEKR